MKPQRTIIPCPNCGKESVEALHYPSYMEHSTSRIAGKSATKYFRKDERYELLSGCSECKKTLKELQEIEAGTNIGLSHEERLKRLRESGLPTQIRSVHNGK